LSQGSTGAPTEWNERTRLHRGVILALAAAVLFGISAPFAKLLLRDAAPQLLAGLLYLGSGVGLALVSLVRGRSAREARLTRRDAPWLAGAIALGGVLGPVLLMAGLARTPASSASPPNAWCQLPPAFPLAPAPSASARAATRGSRR
jgi:drug/metabolite transporter (DMT)-like permease